MLRKLAAVLGLSGLSFCAYAQAPTYQSDPKFTAVKAEADRLFQRQQYVFANDAYKKANQVAGGKCVDCLKQMFAIELGLRDFKNADKAAIALGELDTSANGKALLEMRRAQVLIKSGGDKPKPEQMEAAHAYLQNAIAAVPTNASALYQDGQVLTHLGKLDEARREFAQAAELASPKDPTRLRAQHFAENPELSLHKMAPSFEVTALDGSRFNLDAMGGRVVLIDFWATWCGPCNRALPEMKHIAQEFAGQPLVIISVSWDSDETKWKDFIAKNGMTWLQYRDSDHKLADQFGINNIPHYFTIDSDGVLTAEMVGEEADVEGRLKKMLKRAHEAQKEVAALSPAAMH